MTSFEPPSGAEDLTAQATEVEREREQLDAELASLRERRRERDLSQRRAEVERLRAELAEEPVARPASDRVIDVDPEELGPEPDTDKYDIDPETSKPFLDEDGNPVLAWPHQTVEFKGRVLQVRIPKPAALQVFGLLNSKHTPSKTKNDLVAQFLAQHLSPRSHAQLMDEMMDPDQDFEPDDLSRLVETIAKKGTARPTTPSRD